MQSGPLTPRMRAAIYTAVTMLADPAHEHNRNLTVLRSQIQDAAVRDALQYYTLEGPLKLLDHNEDSFKTGYLQTFEMGWLLEQKPEIYLPVLFYIFDQIEARLTVLRPKFASHLDRSGRSMVIYFATIICSKTKRLA